MSETKLLEMTNITKAFASNVVLNGVNLSVDKEKLLLSSARTEPESQP